MLRWFSGAPDAKRPTAPVEIVALKRSPLFAEEHYLPDKGLVEAANVALVLGQPLLLTGEPGTGKTQFAYRLAWELGLDQPFRFETKSTSVASDLFYTFDTVGRFHATQLKKSDEEVHPVNFLRFGALGKAILQARSTGEIEDLLVSSQLAAWHNGPRRSVVLIDEIDKAPRDFPNDMLNEIERMYFRIVELGNREVGASSELQPAIVITSNSERQLPDPFLRRCVYYHLPFPDRARLEDIVLRRVTGLSGKPGRLVDDAITVFERLRQDSVGLRKKPSTAELLAWLVALMAVGASADQPLSSDHTRATLSALIKAQEDQEVATSLLT